MDFVETEIDVFLIRQKRETFSFGGKGFRPYLPGYLTGFKPFRVRKYPGAYRLLSYGAFICKRTDI